MRASIPNRPLNWTDYYMMENTDIDMVIDIPDTPDRVSRSGSLSREGNKRENDTATVGCPREFHLIDCNYRSGRDRMVLGVGKNSKHQLESQNNCNGLHASRSTPLFRRPTMEKDKGKSICAPFHSTSSASIQKNPVLNLNQRNGFAHVLEMGTPKCLPSEGIPISSGFPSHGAQNSSNVAGENNKAKEKIDDWSCGLACSASVRETLDLFSDTRYKKKDPAVSSTRPVIRASGHRRLVRNGCISPHAIAAKGKQSLEQQTSSDGDINNRSGEEKRASDDLSSVDIREIVAEDDILCRAKGKRVTVHSQTSKDDGASINGDSMGSRDAVESEEWRNTRNHQMTMDCSRPRNNNSRHHETSRRGENDSQRIFRSVPKVEEHEISAVDWEANKRLRSFNGCEVSDQREVSIGGTSGEASNPRPARTENHQRRGMHNPVFEIDDSSLEVQPARGVENVESNVRARQIEADERLARELQEQLYQEAQIFGDEEINETIARMLQEEENTVGASSSRNPRLSNPTSSVAQGRSRLRTRFQQSYSNRGPNIPQTRASVRTSRPRGHFLGPPPSALSRALDLRFPSEMALESRLDILEELETVIGQFGSSMNSGLLQLDRDFNEDDYEMLLALDENNDSDRCVGISANQINSFPQSTVQNDNFEETCVICLETPSTGDVIRHLPCLHKFHKDCIDPWLGRSKSCPVCKCSVT